MSQTWSKLHVRLVISIPNKYIIVIITFFLLEQIPATFVRSLLGSNALPAQSLGRDTSVRRAVPWHTGRKLSEVGIGWRRIATTLYLLS